MNRLVRPLASFLAPVLLLFAKLTSLMALDEFTVTSVTIKSDYLPLTDTSIREAVTLWTSDYGDDRQIAKEFYGPIQLWNTSLVKDMSRLFRNKLDFDEDIRKWDVKGVTNLQLMFYGASSFSYDLSGWNISSAVNLGGMFVHASSYEHSLCWPMLSEFAFVEDMFCGANGGTLDPCCVPEDVVLSACCGDACSSFCFETLTASPTSPPPTPATSLSDSPRTLSPTEVPTNGTVLYTTEPNVTIVNSVDVNESDFFPMENGSFSNDVPTTVILPIEPQIAFSTQESPGQGSQQDKDKSKTSAVIGGIVGFVVGAVAIASIVVVRRRQQQKRRREVAMFGKDYDDEEGLNIGTGLSNDDTLIEGPPDDEDVVECPIPKLDNPKLEDMDIAIEQRVERSGTEAVELSFNDSPFKDYKDAEGNNTGLEDARQSENEECNVLPRVQLKEVRVFGKHV